MAIQERDFERVMNQVRIECPGTSEGGAKGVLFDVMDEFLDVSNVWYEWIQLAIQPGVQIYSIFPQRGGMINRLIIALDSNQVVLPAGIAFGDQPTSAPASPSYIAPPGVVLSLTFPQNTIYTASVLVSKKIILPNNADDIPDGPSWLFPVYGRYIKEGTVGTLMAQMGKSYSNSGPMGAVYHLKKFRDGMAMAKTAVSRSNLFGGQSWGFPRQFRSNSQRGGVSTPFPTPTGQGV